MRTLSRARTALTAAAARGETWLLVWFLGYLLLLVEPYLIYQAQQPPFETTREFATAQLPFAGGLLRYLGLLLAQADAVSWLGALVRLAQAALIFELAARAFSAAAGRRVAPVAWLSLSLYLLLAGRYDQPPMAGPLVLAMLLATNLYLAAGARWWLHPLLSAGLVVLAAGAAGARPMWPVLAGYGVLCGVAAARRASGRTLLVALGHLLVPLLAGALLVRAGLRPCADTWVFAPERSRLTAAMFYALLGSFPLSALLAGVLAGPVAAWRQRRVVDDQRTERRARPGELRLLGHVALVGLLSLLATRVTVDEAGHEHALIDFCATNGQWARLLGVASTGRYPYELASYDVNRALYDQGLLARSMFEVPQRPDTLLLTVDTPYQLAARVRLADQYIDLGRLHLAEYVLHNTLVMGDNNPYLLSRLAKVYEVLDQPAAARIYLNLLTDNLVWRRWAWARLARLAADPSLRGDADIQRLRAVKLTEDDLQFINRYADRPEERAWYIDPEIIAGPLRCHRQHRMALEYLVAYFLLAGRPNFAATEMPRLLDYGENRLPRAWAEGAVVALDFPGRKPDLKGLVIDPECVRRYERFKAVLNEYHDDLRAAMPRLEREFAGTYYLYLARRRLGL